MKTFDELPREAKLAWYEMITRSFWDGAAKEFGKPELSAVGQRIIERERLK